MKRILATALLGCTIATTTAQASSARPVVLELFTSQGCSSCPPADALLVELANDPMLLPLSFHVDYWDRLGWPDTFSSPDSTDRQRDYSHWMGRNNVFTPQLVVDGSASVNGADRAAVGRAIAQAKPRATDLTVMGRRDDQGNLVFHVGAAQSDSNAKLWAVYFQPVATTPVKHGENGGRNLTSVNNVTDIMDLGAWQPTAKDYTVPPQPGQGVAILLQDQTNGRIISAAALYQ